MNGEWLRQQREKQLLTQQQFADKIGVSVGAVSRWEQDIWRPKLKWIPRIADTLGVERETVLEKLR